MKHELKTWPEFFRACRSGDKTFELRYNDRDYKVGDELELNEFEPCRGCGGKKRVHWTNEDVACPDCYGTGGRYTGQRSFHTVTYVLHEHPGIYRGYVILGLRRAMFNADEV